MRASIDGWLASLTVDLSTRQEDRSLTDVHGESNLEVCTEYGQTFVICNKCQHTWTLCFTYSEELGDHFALEPLSNQDPLLCMKSWLVDYLEYNEDSDEPETVSTNIQAYNDVHAIAQVKHELEEAGTKYEILGVEEE